MTYTCTIAPFRRSRIRYPSGSWACLHALNLNENIYKEITPNFPGSWKLCFVSED